MQVVWQCMGWYVVLHGVALQSVACGMVLGEECGVAWLVVWHCVAWSVVLCCSL